MGKFVITFVCLVYAILFISGLNAYTESKFIYILFSVIYLLLLVSGFYKTISYSYIFLVIFLFLGFWLKLTLHLILDYPYIEAIGSFYINNHTMDDVILIASIGAMAVLVVYMLFQLLKFKRTVDCKIDNSQNYFIYTFYKKYKKTIFIVSFFLVATVAILNIILCIQVTGIVPKTILIYPLNALVSWILGIGFAFIFAYFIWIEVLFEKKLNYLTIFLFLVVCAITSIALLSRGQFIFLFGGLVFFILFNYKFFSNFSLIQLFKIVLSGVFLYLIVIYAVTTLRDLYFNGLTIFNLSNVSNVSNVLQSLLADRWVGLEGIMAVVSYPEKSFDLFYNALVAKSTIGSIDIYQYIANSHYKDMDSSKFIFATIPGAMAFLYYSGSYIVVFIGMIILVSLMIFMEKLVLFMSRSTLFASIIGVSLASSVAQFGLTPINVLKSLMILFCFLLCLKFLEKVLSKQSE